MSCGAQEERLRALCAVTRLQRKARLRQGGAGMNVGTALGPQCPRGQATAGTGLSSGRSSIRYACRFLYVTRQVPRASCLECVVPP